MSEVSEMSVLGPFFVLLFKFFRQPIPNVFRGRVVAISVWAAPPETAFRPLAVASGLQPMDFLFVVQLLQGPRYASHFPIVPRRLVVPAGRYVIGNKQVRPVRDVPQPFQPASKVAFDDLAFLFLNIDGSAALFDQVETFVGMIAA